LGISDLPPIHKKPLQKGNPWQRFTSFTYKQGVAEGVISYHFDLFPMVFLVLNMMTVFPGYFKPSIKIHRIFMGNYSSPSQDFFKKILSGTASSQLSAGFLLKCKMIFTKSSGTGTV